MLNKISLTFKEKKIKSTPQRMAIYEILLNTTAHPTVEEIYNVLHPNYPSVSLATVYKTLESFKNVGLVQELTIGENKSRYDACVTPHTHLLCLECERVIDIAPDPIGCLIDKLPNNLDFEVISQQVYFFGKCKDCK
jgi:Fur family peroxide stress response transcriptional regulator